MHRDSAEGKLLKLIKDTAGQKAKLKRQEDEAQKFNAPKSPDFSHSALVKGSTIFTKTSRKIKSLDFESVNKILRLSVGLVCLFFIFDYFYSARGIKNLLKEDVASEVKSDLNSLPKPLKGELTEYSALTDRPDIFSASGALTLGQNRLNSSPNAANFVSNLKLLGIISGQKPQAVIEDNVEQKTYTVGVGDYFKEFLVEEIGSGKVSFSYKGEKFDLFL